MNLESQWTVYRTRFLVRARQLTEPLVFTDALGREQSGRPGDYLVESSEGIRRITTQALFEDIYVPLAPEQWSAGRPRPARHPEPRQRKIASVPPHRQARFQSFKFQGSKSARVFETLKLLETLNFARFSDTLTTFGPQAMVFPS
jgi:hypothetical protein